MIWQGIFWFWERPQIFPYTWMVITLSHYPILAEGRFPRRSAPPGIVGEAAPSFCKNTKSHCQAPLSPLSPLPSARSSCLFFHSPWDLFLLSRPHHTLPGPAETSLLFSRPQPLPTSAFGRPSDTSKRPLGPDYPYSP